MKNLISKFFIFSLSLTIAIFLINGCTHDDDLDAQIPDSIFQYGTDIVSGMDGFNFDKTHSSVRWETDYLGTSALLTGRFNDFAFTVDFDQDNPENTFITGAVTLSTVNTGEPGRDAGCLLGTFATDVSDEATFTSTVVEKDEEGGYFITGDLHFHGITSPVTGTLEYSGTTFLDEGSGVFGAPLNIAGFIIKFEINAKSVFGIESGNIADRVVVIASGQFKQPL